jgi:hypothetical protein
MDVETMLAAIRGAFASDATAEARLAASAACRAMLVVLEPPPQVQPTAPVQLNTAAVANAVTALRGIPPEQLLDLAITKLRGALPAGTSAPAVPPIKFNLITVPMLPERKSS